MAMKVMTRMNLAPLQMRRRRLKALNGQLLPFVRRTPTLSGRIEQREPRSVEA
jgi:hypothetical protein